MIKTTNLIKTFHTQAGEIEVLRGIDIAINDGEMVAVVGASGVGKSTLLHILGALDRPTTGTVLYNDTHIFSLGEQGLTAFRNKTVGFVFQFHHLLPEFTAIENVMMPILIGGNAPHNNAAERATALLDELGLLNRKDHRPGELSGGEQQRVAVARALAMKPSVVLADEPTGNLDTSTGEDLFRLLQGINKRLGTTFVIVTHNESLSSKCHRVLKMVDGKIAA